MAALAALSALACGTADTDPLDGSPATPLTFITTELPTGRVGEGYVAPLEVSGPDGPLYAWRSLGELPSGVTLRSTGTREAVLAGVPTSTGAFTVDIAVQAGGGASVRALFVLPILPSDGAALEVVTEGLPTAFLNEPYEARVDAIGGLPPYSWQLAGQTPGLTLSEDDGTAVLSGIPTRGGLFDVTFVVTDAAGLTAERTFGLEIAGGSALEIVTLGGVPEATVGQIYQIQLEARNGDGPVMWSIASGDVPGLVLVDPSATRATLGGRPELTGEFTVTVRAVDEAGNTATLELVVTVQGSGLPLTFEETRLPAATTGVPYEAELVATGGAGGLVWTALEPLPPGITLEPSGTPATRLVGVPTRNAFYQFRVRVEDAIGATAEAEVFLRVDARALTIVTTALPDGIAEASYREAIVAAGGTGTYTWRLIGGAPSGLSLVPMGTPATELSGIATAAGEFRFTVEVEDVAGATARQDFVVRIAEAPAELTLLTTSVPDAITCLGYDAPLEAVGGQPPYSWVVTTGALPPGVELGPTVGPRVELSGAPTQPGTYTFTVSVIDAANAMRSLNGQVRVTDQPGVARYIAFSGLVTRTLGDFYVADICGPTPSRVTAVTPTDDQAPSVGVVRPLLSPDGSKMAFVGPVTPAPIGDRGVARLYIVDLTGANPSPAVSTIPASAVRPVVSDFEWSPDSRKIAFRAQLIAPLDAPPELYVVDVSNPSSPTTPLKINGPLPPGGSVFVGAYSWSPDSTTLVYVADERRAGTPELYFGRLTGGSVPAHPLPPAGQAANTRVLWRADSGGVFFQGDLDTDDTLSLYHVAWGPTGAGPLNRINPAPVLDGNVALDRFWLSPDGRWLAFVGDIDRDGSENVYAAPVVGGNQGAGMPTVINPPFARERTVLQVRWSPSSDALAIHSDLFQFEQFEVFYVSFTGGRPGGPIRLNPPLPADGDVFSDLETPFWSPDGNWIGFLADAQVDDLRELYVVDLRIPPPWLATRVSPPSSDPRRDARRFEFAPDGSRVALLGDYQTGDGFELFSVDLRGPAPIPAVQLHPNLPPGGAVKVSEFDVAWKADGSAIFFRADLDTRGEDELWMTDLTSDGRRPTARVNPPPRTSGDVVRFGFTP